MRTVVFFVLLLLPYALVLFLFSMQSRAGRSGSRNWGDRLHKSLWRGFQFGPTSPAEPPRPLNPKPLVFPSFSRFRDR